MESTVIVIIILILLGLVCYWYFRKNSGKTTKRVTRSAPTTIDYGEKKLKIYTGKSSPNFDDRVNPCIEPFIDGECEDDRYRADLADVRDSYYGGQIEDDDYLNYYIDEWSWKSRDEYEDKLKKLKTMNMYDFFSEMTFRAISIDDDVVHYLFSKPYNPKIDPHIAEIIMWIKNNKSSSIELTVNSKHDVEFIREFCQGNEANSSPSVHNSSRDKPENIFVLE